MEEDSGENGFPRPRLERRETTWSDAGTTITICKQLPTPVADCLGEQGEPQQKRRRLLDYGSPMVGDEDRGDKVEGSEGPYGTDAQAWETLMGGNAWRENVRTEVQEVIESLTRPRPCSPEPEYAGILLPCYEEFSDPCDDTETEGSGDLFGRCEGALVCEPHFVPASSLITPAEQDAFRDWLERRNTNIGFSDLFGTGEP